MKNIEIPFAKDRNWKYRFFEILPGLLTWSLLALPFILSIWNPTITVFETPVSLVFIFIVGYLLLWFAKSIGLDVRAVQGYKQITMQKNFPWQTMLDDLTKGEITDKTANTPAWHEENIGHLKSRSVPLNPNNIYHAIIIATYNEAREVLEPTILSVINSDFDMKRVILILAYEERGGPSVDATAKDLIKEYSNNFYHAIAVKHAADLPGEVVGKGGNITCAGRELQKYIKSKKIDPLSVIVTTLDADNRPHAQYLPALTYLYSVIPDPLYVSAQPVPMFTNNIWDAPAPSRVIATGNSFWNIVLSVRPHMIRNFSSHAQTLQTLLDTDFWSVRTIVEDGHQFWRTYFRYDGRHEVYPLYIPIYQDAVLSSNLRKTLKAQFMQLRRWAYGASDVAYVAQKGFLDRNKVSKIDMLMKFGRLLEGHVTWAVAPIILAFSSFVPALIHPKSFAANELPIIASRIQTVALLGILLTLFLSLKMLPPKPERYKRRRTFWMIIQWVMLPVTTIGYNSFAAIYSQTRLMFGKYLEHFDVTDKAVVAEDKTRVI